jgi:hypothetical protein
VRTLRAENQQLRDELNRLKGGQGKPDILANRRPVVPPVKHSSEQERREPRALTPAGRPCKGGKRDRLTITREQVLRLDRRTLPPDAARKGYEDVVVQDVVFRPDTIRFRKEKWYARSTGETYLAPLPAGYAGQFGPGVEGLALALY